MIDNLPLFHRLAGKPVIVLGTGPEAVAKRRLVERAGGVVVGPGNTEARLAFIALPDEQAAEAVRRLRGRGVLVNVVDRPALSDFIVPSVLDRAPVLIAVGTGGVSAGLAKALRQRLETLLPPALGELAGQLGKARAAMKARWPNPGKRRLALDAALSPGGRLDPLAPDSASRVAGWLAGGAEVQQAGLHEITLRSTDPDDFTLKEARLLGAADVVFHDPFVPAPLLDRARADAVRIVITPGEALPEAQGLVVYLRR